MVAAMELSPLYRTFQVYKFGNRKYNFLLNYFVVLNVWHGFVFCQILISIPLNIETSIPRYFARRYLVRCWYRVPLYSPMLKKYFHIGQAVLGVTGMDGLRQANGNKISLISMTKQFPRLNIQQYIIVFIS